MRIVSLLPSLTELVFALGHGSEVVGVTHECDFPPGVERLPNLTRSLIPTSASSAEIDAAVAAQGGSLYELDAALLDSLKPDLILTQEQCDVCAVNEVTVRRVASTLPGSPRVESVNPTDLAGVHAMFRLIGDLIGARAEAERIISSFHTAAAEIARRVAGRKPRAAVLLEWFDPPFDSGHWNPELIALAGGVEQLGAAGEVSRRRTWDEFARADPEVVILSPCGFSLERSSSELPTLLARPEYASTRAARSGSVVLVDGSAYFSRPGPRLEASLRIAAAAINPGICDDLAPAGGWRRIGRAK